MVLRATPTQFTWTTPDGTEHTTTETGGYETGAAPITFERREHRTALTLTTTWEGHYSLNGGTTWTVAPGTATTTSAPTSIHIYNPRARLVDCDSTGHCTHGKPATTTGPTLTDPDNDGIDNHTIPDDHINAYLDTRNKDRAWTSTERRTEAD